MIEAARQLSRFCDVYKAEFPGTLGHESEQQLEDNLHALDAASERPWVLLSAGVDYPDYFKQVEMAMERGRLGRPGRPGLLEGVLPPGRRRERAAEFAATTARKRVADVDALVREPRHPLVRPLRLHQGRAGHDPGRRGLARPLRHAPAGGRGGRARPGGSGRGVLIGERRGRFTGA